MNDRSIAITGMACVFPGAKSLEAVLAPASTRYFYFVARGEGRHTFSETYDAHAAAVHR